MKHNYGSPFILLSILFLFPLLSDAQVNFSTPYCMPLYSISPCNQPNVSNAPGNTFNHFIDGVATSGAILDLNNIGTGCNGLTNNYIYYCQPRLVVAPDQAITFSVQSGDTYDQSFGIFIDWNQNSMFDLPSEMIGGSLVPPTATSWFAVTYTVPHNQAYGKYRMRVRSYTVTPNALVDPCNLAQVGETEDYDVYVDNSIPPPLSSNLSVNSPLCVGGNINFILSHNGTSSTSYTWTGPNNFTSNMQMPTFTAITTSLSGTYNVLLNDGACYSFKSIQVSVTPLPTLSINSPTICSGDQTTLTVSGATTYTWSSGQNSNTLLIQPISTTTLQVTGTTNSCSSVQSTTITVEPTFNMSSFSSASVICDGNTVTIGASGAATYSWNHGPTTSVTVVNPSMTTIYTVSGTNGPCSSQAFITIHVENCSGLRDGFSESKEVLVYPNPTENQLNISWKGIGHYCLYNSVGGLLLCEEYALERPLDTSLLKPGIYVLVLSSNTESRYVKIVKN